MVRNGSPVTETPRNAAASSEPKQITPRRSEDHSPLSLPPATDKFKSANGSPGSSKRDSLVANLVANWDDAPAPEKKASSFKKRKTASSDESSPSNKKRATAPKAKGSGAAKYEATVVKASSKGKDKKANIPTPPQAPETQPKPEARAELTPQLRSKIQSLTHFIDNFSHAGFLLRRAEGQSTQYQIAEIHLNHVLHRMALDFGLDRVSVNLALIQDAIVGFFSAPVPGNPAEFRWLTLDTSAITDFEKLCLGKVNGWALDDGVKLLEVECEIFWREKVMCLETGEWSGTRDVPLPGWRAWPHATVGGALDEKDVGARQGTGGHGAQ